MTPLKSCVTPALRFLLFFLLIVTSNRSHAQSFPEGFTSVQVATGILKPTAMAFAPDGRIFIAQQDGAVRVVKNGSLLTTPLIKLRVNVRGEGGLVGIALDPNFATSQYMYLYYTLPDGSRNRISRFKCSGDLASLSSETVLLNLDTLTATIHNGGAMHFKDGKLFISTGENSNEAHAQNLDTYHGKVLRINPDGSIPTGNPFTSGSEQRRRIWAYGLRNPFTFDVQPGTGKIFVNDVGLEKWEEINDATVGGKNYGWPDTEGASTNASFTNPFYAYAHGRLDEFGCAITGGVFFNPVATNYPSSYHGKYFFQDFCGQWIKTLTLTSTTPIVENFASAIGDDALYLSMGTDGNLYYLLRSTSSLHKIVYTQAQAPAILKHPMAASVPLGQPATFSVTASGQTPITFQWLKNEVAITGATSATYTIQQTTSGSAGNYRVRVSNSFGSALSNNAQLTITSANSFPVAEITTPASGSLYRAGDVITFSGSATDGEDGVLNASQFTWFVDFHHDTHHHDGPPAATGVKSGSFTIPTRGETSDNVWYRIHLIVSDSQGGTDSVYRDIFPRKSTITLATQPTGLSVKIDGQAQASPLSIVSVENLERSIGVLTPQQANGKTYTFEKWLHGGTETQTISTPLEDVTYTAVFKEGSASTAIQRELWTEISGTDVSTIPVNTTPVSITDLASFEGPTNSGSDYGARIRGFIAAPTSGNYVFWISSDDKSELWLSTNEDPSNKMKIASVTGYTSVRQYTKYAAQQSALIPLTAGQRYYIEALHKEAAGGDHISVGWQLPNGALERPIPGTRLTRFEPQITTGKILREVWTGVAGTSVTAIPIQSPPTQSSELTLFEGPTNVGSDYGTRIRGALHPPVSGNYIFWIASDDKSELWLSTTENPTDKVKIASVTGYTSVRQWNKYTTQQSLPVALVAGKKYYIEALHKEGSGADHIAVGWQLPNGIQERPIPGSRLSLPSQTNNNPPSISIVAPAPNQLFHAPASIRIAVSAVDTDGSIANVQFFEGTNLIAEDNVSPYEVTLQNFAPGNFTFNVRAVDNHGSISNASVSISVTGAIDREFWQGITGTSVTSIPVSSPPSSSSLLLSLEGPTNVGSDYGSRIRGYLHPASTGNYTFWIASDDKSELWLSTNDDPLLKSRIASVSGYTEVRQWTKYAIQQSSPIRLEANKKYYVEVLHKEGAGRDHVAVGWQLPNGVFERPIPGTRITPFSSGSASALETFASAFGQEQVSEIEDESNDEISIFPNPAHNGQFTVRVNAGISQSGNLKISIVSSSGMKMFSLSVDCADGCHEIPIETEDLPAGIYTLFVSTDRKQFPKRLMLK
jgi:glucose/arabinose dehydrogenase